MIEHARGYAGIVTCHGGFSAIHQQIDRIAAGRRPQRQNLVNQGGRFFRCGGLQMVQPFGQAFLRCLEGQNL